jgi:hypothetical protein
VATPPKLDATAVPELGAQLRANIKSAVMVSDEVVRDVLVALLAEGHVLIEDRPGVGKTALARSIRDRKSHSSYPARSPRRHRSRYLNRHRPSGSAAQGSKSAS